MPTYQGSGAEVRKGDVVRLAPVYRYGNLNDRDGTVVRVAHDGSWVDVRFYVGPGSLFPEIDTRTRRIPTHRLNLVRRAEGK